MPRPRVKDFQAAKGPAVDGIVASKLEGFDLETWWIPFHQGVSGLKGVNGYSVISLISRASGALGAEALLIFGAGPG